MNPQPKAKIFLAENRGCNETDWCRNYSTFNFEEYFSEHKSPFGELYAVNDQTIGGNHSLTRTIAESSYVVLLPVVGTLFFKINSVEHIVNPGGLQIVEACAGTQIAFLNCYENELINFIEVLIKLRRPGIDSAGELINFELEAGKNGLIPITGPARGEAGRPAISIGKFAGRREGDYKLGSRLSKLFVFVIEGVFEVQGRLLHARDGLGLCDECDQVELEALSNDAIVLTIEMWGG